jgi:hypothetical protein
VAHASNVAIDYRFADGPYERLTTLAAEFVRRPVSLLIDQPADLRSNTDMAVIVSSHRTTAATMNSIHSLLSENHPCTLFMAHDLVALNWNDQIQV